MFFAMQDQQKEKPQVEVSKVELKELSFANFVPSAPRRITRQSQGWVRISAKRADTVGFLRHSKDEDEIIYYEIPIVAGTYAEKQGRDLVQVSSDRSLAVRTAAAYGKFGSRIFLFGWDNYFRKPKYERATPDSAEEK